LFTLFIGKTVSHYRPKVLVQADNRWMVKFPLASTGPFKGVLVASWWIKIQKLQLRFDFEKIAPLSEAICFLQPYIPEVWEYLSWNMTFNLVAEMDHDPKIQLYWFKRGMQQLKKGLLYNSNNSLLHLHSGWTVYMKLKGDQFSPVELEQVLQINPWQFVYCEIKQSRVFDQGTYDQACFFCQVLYECGKMVEFENHLGRLYSRFPQHLAETVNFITNLRQHGKQYQK